MSDDQEPKHGVRVWTIGQQLVAHGATWAFKPDTSRKDYAYQYSKNAIHAERDYAAEPPESVESALTDKDSVLRNVNPIRTTPIDEDGAYYPWFVGDPNCEYYAHLDMSKVNDDTGLSICHYDVETDKVVVDLIQTIRSLKDWKLSFERVSALIFTWIGLGFRFKSITFDQWQSYNMIEKLTNAGIPAGLYSVDRGTDAYDTLIEILLTGRLDYYNQARFIKEMRELKLYKGNKYDHPPEGSKDTSDAVAGCVSACIKDRIGLSLKSSEVEAVLHDEHTLAIAKTKLESGATLYDIEENDLMAHERLKKRIARIDVNDTNLIFILGWYDKQNEQLYVDEVLVWEFYNNEECLLNLQEFNVKLMRKLNVESYSLSEHTPLELVNFLKNAGRRIDSPLVNRGGFGGKAAGKASKVSAVNDSTIRVAVSQLKKGNLSIPHNPFLIKDLKFMTDENQRHRTYVKALAAWISFASMEVSFGRSGMQAPRILSTQAAPINPIVRQTQQTTSSAKVGNGDIDRLRQKYGVKPVTPEKHAKQEQELKAPGRMPRIRRI